MNAHRQYLSQGRPPGSSRKLARGSAAPFWVNAMGFALSRLQFPGKYRLVCRLGTTISHLCPVAECRPRPQCHFSVQLSDRIQRLMWAGCYETELVTLMENLLANDMVFVDVGAHAGYFSVIAASLVGRGGSVLSFEADPACFEWLERNAAAYPWVRILRAAVGDRAGECAFFRSGETGESGWGSTLGSADLGDAISVPGVTLDSALASRSLGRVDLIKLDVEGAEPRVFRGADRTLASFRPLVYFEVNEVCLAREGVTAQTLCDDIVSRGYELWTYLGRQASAFSSLLAIPREKNSEKTKAAAAKFRPVKPRPVSPTGLP